MSDSPRFIHLRARSAYSLREGAIHVKALPKLAVHHAMPALALADANSLFGALEFAEACVKAGVQPIMGLTLMVAVDGADPAPLALYAQDDAGWRNLMALSTAAFLETDATALPHVALERLAAHATGVICLTGGPDGPVARLVAAGRPAAPLTHRLRAMFPDRLYVELHRHGVGAPHTGPEAATEPGLVALAHDLDLPLVATNDIYFDTPAMHTAHDAFLCIGEGRYVSETDRRQVTPEQHFKSPAEMVARFADLPEAIASTVEIAQRCAVRPRTHGPILPKFADNEVAALAAQARAGLAARLAATVPVAEPAVYAARLDYELGVIERMQFPGYFLIVADFIQWAKAQGIPVGPGRGSGAGSLVAYALTITDLDPLRYGLLFERFLNPERVSMPDFDIDFCQDRREEVIAYVARRYGADRVAQIITFGALMSKAAIRDVARVLQMSYSQADRLAKLIPLEGVRPLGIAEARRAEPKLEEEARRDETTATMLDLAEQLEGLLRNASTHAAGVVIGDRPLVELVPLYRDPRSEMPATQYNMKWVEPAGLVKFDFLGLKTLTVIQTCLDLLAARGVVVDIATIPLDDPATYALYARADVVGVFQVESQGMREALRQLRPTAIEDIVALVALYRPGPMENIPLYCKVKHGAVRPNYYHPKLEPILRETMGIIVYQEQVMEIARVLAGYSLGGADLLRRAMGKKIKAEMDAQRPKFLDGCAANGVDPDKASEIFDLLAKFADYGFNKSHAAAYALVSYQTAWLKATYPVEFMAAVLTLDINFTDKLAATVAECAKHGLAVDPPCVNRSGANFTVAGGRIRYALGALKGVGVEAMRGLVASRGDRPFADLFDLAARADLKSVGKRPLEALARAGAFDALDPNRARVLANLDALADHSAMLRAEAGSAQVSLFGDAAALPPPRLIQHPGWDEPARLAEELAAAGFYLSGHPLDDAVAVLRRLGVLGLGDFLARHGRGGAGRIAGTLVSAQTRKSARGTRFAYLAFSEPSGGFEVMAFADVLDAHQALLVPGANLVLAVEVQAGEEAPRLMLRGAQAVADVVAGDGGIQSLRIHVDAPQALASIAARLRAGATLAPRGARAARLDSVTLVLVLADRGQECEVTLPGPWTIPPALPRALKDAPGVLAVEVA